MVFQHYIFGGRKSVLMFKIVSNICEL